MRTRLLISFIIMPFILTLFSCDEFLLKKTVNILSIKGEITYAPDIPQVSGNIDYKIKNTQDNPLKEVYLICHPQVEVEQVMLNNKKVSFEIGEAPGNKIYRVKIPHLDPGQGALLSLRFLIQGEFHQDRFILARDKVFFDVKKIWLPVPFADHFDFPYELKVNSPENFYSIMGAAKHQETVQNKTRSVMWKSEVNFALITGSLHILPYVRHRQGNVFYYSQTTNNLKRILDFTHFAIQRIEKHMGPPPFSEYHIVNQMYPYPKMKEIMDGEYLANNILLAPSICDFTNYSTEKYLLRTPIPFLPNTSEVKLLEVISHELIHSYVSTLLRFDDEYHIHMEALTEFLAIDIMKQRNKNFLDLMYEKNRIMLINLDLQNQNRSLTWKYLYLVNTLEAAFWQNNQWSFKYLQLLVNKYRFSEIQWKQLITTTEDINRSLSKDTNRILLNQTVMENWKNMSLYNFSLSSTEVRVTNHALPSWKALQKKKKVQIKSHFPYTTDSILLVYKPNEILSNRITLRKNSSTNLLLDMDTITTRLVSRFSLLETHLADNSINYKDRSWQDLVYEINRFYKGENHNTRFMIISKRFKPSSIRKEDARWKSLYDDRVISQNISPHVYFQYDQVYFNKKEFYVEAYKWIDNKAYSYVIFKGKVLKNKLQILSILDPTL